MNLLDYLKLLPIKKYLFSLIKKNKNKPLRFSLMGEELRLKYVYKDTIERGTGPFSSSNANDLRKEKHKGMHMMDKSEINKHDGVRLIFEYEDW